MTYAELMELYLSEGLSIVDAEQGVRGAVERMLQATLGKRVRCLGAAHLSPRPSVLDRQVLFAPPGYYPQVAGA